MAKSQSVTFEAEANKVWGAVVKLVTAAGYAVSETNTAAKQIKYSASGGGWAWAQLVTISVTGVEDNETIVTVKAESAGQASLTEGGQQSKLISFALDKLTEKFPVSENQTKATSGAPGTPGTNGCAGLVLLLAVTVLSVVLVGGRILVG
jgi:hypothetical protein